MRQSGAEKTGEENEDRQAGARHSKKGEKNSRDAP